MCINKFILIFGYNLKINTMKNLTVKGNENLTLKPEGGGMFEIWCKVWEGGKRNKSKDGYFLKSILKLKR